MSKILIVEDEIAVYETLKDVLEAYDVDGVHTVADALRYVKTYPVDLVLLDLQLGANDGMTVARYVREHFPYTAVVILTGHGSLKSAIQAIELNAQAYLLKPVSPDDLETTVEEQIALMQEHKQRDKLAHHMQQAIENVQEPTVSPPSNYLASGKLSLDRERYEVMFDGHEITVSPTQFRILWILLEAAGDIVAPRDIASHALGYDVNDNEASDLVKGHISKIRRKLGTFYGDVGAIRTIRNEGYMWVD